MKKTVIAQSTPTDVVPVQQMDPSKLYGVQHGKNPNKKYKLHIRADEDMVELCGFLSSTGHLKEDTGFVDLQEAFNYCQEKGHTLYEFDSAAEFGAWLQS